MKSAKDWGRLDLNSDEKLSPVVREIKETENIYTFKEIAAIIERSRENAFRAVNRELITMYWDVGEYISIRTKEKGWGKATVKEFAEFMKVYYPEVGGFSPQNIWRMKQFYETYAENEKLSPLVREISWSNNLIIMMAAKSDEEREFYLLLSSLN